MAITLRKKDKFIEINNDGVISLLNPTAYEYVVDGTNVVLRRIDTDFINDIVIPYSQVTSPVTANINALVQGLRDWANPAPVILPNSKPFDTDDRLYNNSDVVEFEGVPIGGGGGGGNVANGTSNFNSLRWDDGAGEWIETDFFKLEPLNNYFGGITTEFVPGSIIAGFAYVDAGTEISALTIQDDQAGQRITALSWQGQFPADDNSYVGVVNNGNVVIVGSVSTGFTSRQTTGITLSPADETIRMDVETQTEDVRLLFELDRNAGIDLRLTDTNNAFYNNLEIDKTAITLNYRAENTTTESKLEFFQNVINLEGDSGAANSILRFNLNPALGAGTIWSWAKAGGNEEIFTARYNQDIKTFSINLEDNISTGYTSTFYQNIDNGEAVLQIFKKDGSSGQDRKSELNVIDQDCYLVYVDITNQHSVKSGVGLNYGAIVYNNTNTSASSRFIVGTDYTSSNASVITTSDGNTNTNTITVSESDIQLNASDGTDVITITVRSAKNAGGALLNVLGDLPEYADNAAALAGNCVAGDIYRTSDNTLKIVV